MKQWLWLGKVALLSILATFTLVACGSSGSSDQTGDKTSNQSSDKSGVHHDSQNDVKPVKKLGTDASQIAQATAQFLVPAEQLIVSKPQPDQLSQQVFQPVRQLLLRWNTEIKQGDSVVGDQYTICRGALVSLDSWARSVQDNSTRQAEKQALFKRQQRLCDQALLNSKPSSIR